MNAHNVPCQARHVETAERPSPTPAVELRWQAFVAAKAKAERTGAIAAGKAWRSFLETFLA